MSQLGDLQRAIPYAHTYLQRNPDDPEMLAVMEEYRSRYDLSGYLTDHEEQPYEVRPGSRSLRLVIDNNPPPLPVVVVSSRPALSEA